MDVKTWKLSPAEIREVRRQSRYIHNRVQRHLIAQQFERTLTWIFEIAVCIEVLALVLWAFSPR